MFFAYDSPDDYEPLVEAGKLLRAAGLNITTRGKHPGTPRHSCRCYVLCGYRDDTLPEAQGRMLATIRAGFMPSAMFYRGEGGQPKSLAWSRFQRAWFRPAAMSAKVAA